MDSKKKQLETKNETSNKTAHDWQYYKRRNKEITDDQTMSFFWYIYSLSLFLLIYF